LTEPPRDCPRAHYRPQRSRRYSARDNVRVGNFSQPRGISLDARSN